MPELTIATVQRPTVSTAWSSPTTTATVLADSVAPSIPGGVKIHTDGCNAAQTANGVLVDGLTVVTAAHAVLNDTQPQVETQDHVWNAELAAWNDEFDLALLILEPAAGATGHASLSLDYAEGTEVTITSFTANGIATQTGSIGSMGHPSGLLAAPERSVYTTTVIAEPGQSGSGVRTMDGLTVGLLIRGFSDQSGSIAVGSTTIEGLLTGRLPTLSASAATCEAWQQLRQRPTPFEPDS